MSSLRSELVKHGREHSPSASVTGDGDGCVVGGSSQTSTFNTQNSRSSKFDHVNEDWEVSQDDALLDVHAEGSVADLDGSESAVGSRHSDGVQCVT